MKPEQVRDTAADVNKTTAVSVQPSESPGSVIGRYKLLEQIGEGGCGVVYVAEQEQPMRRRVALKIIKLGMDTRQVIARFEAERQALAIMDHPNIAKVLDAGTTENGRPFFVMELVKGIPITRYCDENKLDTRQRLNLFIQVCQAIQHAHQKGIIHRDIKPSNVLVADHDGVPIPKVIDFGIAKATSDQRLTDKTLYTAIEQFIGTPAYMSPEQAKLSGLDVDTRSDIYSLGVLLYELLTGRTPFDSKRLVEAGLDEIRRIIREEDPPKPSTRLSTLGAKEQTDIARRRQSEVPKLLGLFRGDLDWIVMKSLEKDRTRRYNTVTGLANDLNRHLSNAPVVARPPSGLYRVQKVVERNKVAFAAATAVTTALLLGLGASTWLFVKEKAAHRQALAAQRAEKQLRQGNTLRELETEISNLLYGDEFSKTEALYRQALQIRKELSGIENSNVVILLDGLAKVLLRQRRFADSEAAYREALELQRRLSGSDHGDVAALLCDMSQTLWSEGKFVETQSACREALTILGKLSPDVHPSLWQHDWTLSLFATNLAAALDRRKLNRTNPVVSVHGYGDVVDPEGDCTINAQDGQVTLVVPGSFHDICDWCPTWLAATAPRILREIDGDFSVQVTVSGEYNPGTEKTFELSRPGEAAGLLLWENDGSYILFLCNTYVMDNGTQASYGPFWLKYVKEYRKVTPRLETSIQYETAGRPTYLRMTRQGDDIRVASSYDGVEWTERNSVTTRFPKTVRVGVVAENTSNKTFTAVFGDFKLTRGN
jgi:hypothetical protein